MSQPISQVLLELDAPLQNEIVTQSGIKFFHDGSWSKEWSATVTAKVSKLPIKISPKHSTTISQLKEGDEVCISYQVVYDLEFGSDGANFIHTLDDNPHRKELVNGRGDWIRVYALPSQKGITGKIWVGYLQNKFRQIIDGIQGTESEVERWLAQFPIGKTDNYTFNNFFSHNNNDYWKCDIDRIFAKRVKGHLVAVGNRVICVPIEEDVPEEVKKSLQYTGELKIRYTDRARVLSSANKKFKKDEVVQFDPHKAEKYEFYNKQYLLIRDDLVLGKWNKK